jgi:ParB-like chromosome segregation protein Spo0J
MERRGPRNTADARSTIKRLEQRLARLESELRRARGEGSRASGAARLRLRGLEQVAKKQIAQAQVTIKDSAARLSRALADPRNRKEVAEQIARARTTLRKSFRRLSRSLAGSSKTVEREARLLARGLRAGIRAGSKAYRRKR